MSKRVWIISDTHLGCRSNSVLWLTLIEDYFFNFFIPLVKEKHKEGDVLYHTGDVFDNRQSINLRAQDLGIRIFEELSKIFGEINIIVGNHDIMRKNSNEISSVDCLKYIPNVNVYKDLAIIDYDTARCFLMPWRRDVDHEIETVNLCKQSLSEDKFNFLFCHSEVQGIRTNPSQRLYEGGNDVKVFKDFDRVYSGHIHYRQERDNFVLVGNPYQMTRSDRGNEKGIYILDLESGKHEFIINDYSPKFIKFYINNFLIHKVELNLEI